MNVILDPGLALYLPLHELGGSSFVSKDAYGHLSTVTGACWKSGGRYFDGTDDIIRVPCRAVFNTGSAITVMVWVNGAASNNRQVISHYDWGLADRAWTVACHNNTSLSKVSISDDGSADAGHFKCYLTSIAVFNSSWHHFAFTFDSGVLKLFVDGVEDTVPGKINDGAITSIYSSSADIVLGAYLNNDTPEAFYPGNTGEVVICSRALTPLEIQHNYLATKWRYQ